MSHVTFGRFSVFLSNSTMFQKMKNYFMKRHATFTIVFPPSERSIKVCTEYGTALGDDVGVMLKKPAAEKGGKKMNEK